MELNRQRKECRRNLAIVQPSLGLNMKSKIIVDKGNCNVNTAKLKKPGQIAVTLGKHPQNHRLIVSSLITLEEYSDWGPFRESKGYKLEAVPNH